MGVLQYRIDHGTFSTCCHVGRHVDFQPFEFLLVPHAFEVYWKVNLDHLWLLNQSQNLYITCQWFSCCSVKRPQTYDLVWHSKWRAKTIIVVFVTPSVSK